MNSQSVIELIFAALGGGVTVKILDVIYQEIRNRSDRTRSARAFVDQHLDQVIKAADELSGKIASLAREDFRGLKGIKEDEITLSNSDFSSVIYLFARFWANLEAVRIESRSIDVMSDPRGKAFSEFVDCLESGRVRIVDRISQRAIGELMLLTQSGSASVRPFIEFITIIEGDKSAQRWVKPAVKVLTRSNHRRERQLIIQYGIILQAMIDELDPKRRVSRPRPVNFNKTTKKTWRDLKYRVFGQYLRRVKEPYKYIGPPKRRP